MKNFPLNQIMTVATGRLFCEMGGVYEILNYMTGDNLYTHQLPRALRECGPWIIRQHPQLRGVGGDLADESAPAQITRWLESKVKEFGAELPVEPIPKDDHEVKDPMQEMIEMVGPDRVVAISPPHPSSS